MRFVPRRDDGRCFALTPPGTDGVRREASVGDVQYATVFELTLKGGWLTATPALPQGEGYVPVAVALVPVG